MNLFKSELTRIARRRLTLVFGILGLAGVLLLAVGLMATSDKGPSEDELAEAQATADGWNEQNPDYMECASDEDFFEDHPDYEWAESDSEWESFTHQERCERYVGGSMAQDYIYTYTFDFSADGPSMLIGIVVVAGLVMMLLAASLIGAEWASGGMSNVLVWHPNRTQVWGTKLAALLTACVIAVVAVTVLAFGLLYVTAAVRGEVGDLSLHWWSDTLLRVCRSGILALMMTALGASLAMLGRHTAIAGGVIAGYLIIGDGVVSLASEALQLSFPDRLSLYTWVSAWLDGRVVLYDYTTAGWEYTEEVMVITATDAGLLLAAITVVFAALATWSFKRRDAS